VSIGMAFMMTDSRYGERAEYLRRIATAYRLMRSDRAVGYDLAACIYERLDKGCPQSSRRRATMVPASHDQASASPSSEQLCNAPVRAAEA